MFLDTAVRALFQEVPLTGSSPVNIAGIGYDLPTQLQPDPEQIIELYIVSEGIQSAPSQAPLDAEIGDMVQLRCIDFNFSTVCLVRNRQMKEGDQITLHLSFSETKFPIDDFFEAKEV